MSGKDKGGNMKKEGIGKKFKKLRRSKYRLRILLTFFLVAMISMAVIDVSVLRGLAGDIREDSDRETREMLHSLTESFESQADQYQEQAQLLYRNMDVKSFLVSGGREDSHLDSIYESMKAMAGNMTGISSVILFHGQEILASILFLWGRPIWRSGSASFSTR